MICVDMMCILYTNADRKKRKFARFVKEKKGFLGNLGSRNMALVKSVKIDAKVTKE